MIPRGVIIASNPRTMHPPGSGESSGISDAQLDSMMMSICQGLKELSAMKRGLSAEREAADEKLVKKLKCSVRKATRSSEVRLKLSDAAKMPLEEGEKLIAERQKHNT